MNQQKWRLREALVAPNYPAPLFIDLAEIEKDLEAALASGELVAAFKRADRQINPLTVSFIRSQITRRKLTGILGRDLWSEFVAITPSLMRLKPVRTFSRADQLDEDKYKLMVYKYLVSYLVDVWKQVVALWLMQLQSRDDMQQFAQANAETNLVAIDPISVELFWNTRGKVGFEDVMQIIEVIPHAFNVGQGRKITPTEFSQILDDTTLRKIILSMALAFSGHLDPLLLKMRKKDPVLLVKTLDPSFFSIKPKKNGGWGIHFSEKVPEGLFSITVPEKDASIIHTGCPFAHVKDDAGLLLTTSLTNWLVAQAKQHYVPLYRV